MDRWPRPSRPRRRWKPPRRPRRPRSRSGLPGGRSGAAGLARLRRPRPCPAGARGSGRARTGPERPRGGATLSAAPPRSTARRPQAPARREIPEDSSRADSRRHRPALGGRRRPPRRPRGRRAVVHRRARRARPPQRRRAPRHGRVRRASPQALRHGPGGTGRPAREADPGRVRRRGRTASTARRPAGSPRRRCDASSTATCSSMAVWLAPITAGLGGDQALAAELVARGVVEGGFEPKTIYREDSDAAPPVLDELVLVVADAAGRRGARRRARPDHRRGREHGPPPRQPRGQRRDPAGPG